MAAVPEALEASDSRRARGAEGVRRLFAGARTRILAAFIMLLAASTAVSVIGIYELLLVRTSDRVNASLRQEVDEFRQLSRGVDPQTGRPFGDDLEGIFRVYRERDVPREGEIVVIFSEGRLFDTLSGPARRTGRLRSEHGMGGAALTTRGDRDADRRGPHIAMQVSRRNGTPQGCSWSPPPSRRQNRATDACGSRRACCCPWC